MFIEKLNLTNFRCFGPDATAIELCQGLTTFVGVNGAGKTAALQALQRLFGITGDERRLRRQDFHVPVDESAPPLNRTRSLDLILGSGLIGHSQKMTVAASATAEKKTVGQRS